ncbi:MAG: hypothetical protein ABUL62_02600 [Myxococcales bacterium]
MACRSRYRLTFTPDKGASPQVVFDQDVTYVETIDTVVDSSNPKPELCDHWGVAEVDLTGSAR